MGRRGKHRHSNRVDPRLPTGFRPTVGPGEATRVERRQALRRIKRRKRRSAVNEVPILVVVALGIALVLKTFLVQAFVIPSGSMENTIRIGDRVLVDKLTPWFGSKPQRGDVVVFKDPGGWLEKEQTRPKDDPVVVAQLKGALTFIGLLPSEDEQDLIKRVVAVGGDTVKCCDQTGRVTVNGTPLDEPYLRPGNEPSKMRFQVNVPPGRLFMLGDHRANSADSRFHLDEVGNGTVPEDVVVGKAMVIAWPFSHWRQLEEPGTYASVPERGAVTAAGAPPGTGPPAPVVSGEMQGLVHLPSPAELPLVMGVVGLHRVRPGRQSVVRSGCGGCGGRRTFRSRRARATRGPSREADR